MVDIHAHFDDEAFDADRDEIINSLFAEKGLKAVINAGCDVNTSLFALKLAEKYENLYATAGIHPQEVYKCGKDDISVIEDIAKHKKNVAIGEIGLDYHYGADHDEREAQKRLFEEQLILAERLSLPVEIHERDAMGDCLEIVLRHKGIRGVFHSFSGSRETAEILLKNGWYISFSGTVTFKNAVHPVENAAFVPLDRILTETDSPYLTPHPFRGKRNDSGYMKYTVARIAEIRGMCFEEVENITENNAKTLFGLEF